MLNALCYGCPVKHHVEKLCEAGVCWLGFVFCDRAVKAVMNTMGEMQLHLKVCSHIISPPPQRRNTPANMEHVTTCGPLKISKSFFLI